MISGAVELDSSDTVDIESPRLYFLKFHSNKFNRLTIYIKKNITLKFKMQHTTETCYSKLAFITYVINIHANYAINIHVRMLLFLE